MSRLNSDTHRAPGRPRASSQDIPLDQTILHTAARSFMEQGYDPVSLQQIAKSCGVTKASVYYYFNNKAALFTAAMLFMLDIAYRETHKMLMEDAPLHTRLERIAAQKMRQSHVDMETMMREATKQLSQEQLNSIKQAEQAIHLLMAEHFQTAMQQNRMRESDPLFLAHAFSSLLMMSNRGEALYSSVTDPEKLPKIVIELFWQGVHP